MLINMEKALVLGKLSHRVPREIINKISGIEGVNDASLIFGPYDFYALAITEKKATLSRIILQIRDLEGVLDTLTCYAVDFSEIRPEPRGPHAE